ncbi:MAG: hypothetical protein KUA43_13110 [Hoeflea sp.]|uniref:hypothetical protein n=1 Tax=Hoeflea sp. TaxID=1940281 RepID=UPI001D5A1BFB|nr:hypothetical protein [Hoeflea sp.]MBU4527951.1 hypothetical protein [Alphaproteobacteria bacterium]MBU4546014.1 hypothetical protein [Alphaproteobacteria bacterium]MBU4553301.1 hypothetical protein [Alphaproteobacteria bacterium]MBV1724375.1 hypothetical protein [Hoeflea sp.]MBV1763371.1 hypothetical protein [Hoeflea sp.]
MKKIILTAAAVSLGMMFAAAGAATAQTRATSIKPMPAAATKLKVAGPATAAGVRDNTAHEWTAGCYAEFGPDATNPDPVLLEKCLN